MAAKIHSQAGNSQTRTPAPPQQVPRLFWTLLVWFWGVLTGGESQASGPPTATRPAGDLFEGI